MKLKDVLNRQGIALILTTPFFPPPRFFLQSSFSSSLSRQVEEAREYIDEIVFYIRDQFVDGRISTAKNLVMDCVIVTQNRHCIAQLDKASYSE